MAGPKGQELGVRSPLKLRVGYDIERFRGENQEDEGAAIGSDEFQVLINARHKGRGLSDRSGLSKVNDVPLPNCPTLIHEAKPDPGTVRLYWNRLIAFGETNTTFKIRSFSGSQQREEITVSPALAEVSCYAYHKGKLYIGYDETGFGNTHVAIAPLLTSALSVARVGTSSAHIHAMRSFGGTLYLQMSGTRAAGGGGVGQDNMCVYSWDGESSTLTVDDAGSDYDHGAEAHWMEEYNGTLYASYKAYGGSHLFRKRVSAGNWTTLTNPGTITAFRVHRMMVYRSVLYIAGVGTIAGSNYPVILSYNGTSMAVARQVSGTAIPTSVVGVTDMALLNGTLYFLWRHNDGTIRIGSYDGTTWTDTFKNLTTDFASIAPFEGLGIVGARDGSLYVGLVKRTGVAPFTGWIVRSPSGDPAGTWTTPITVVDAGGDGQTAGAQAERGRPIFFERP